MARPTRTNAQLALELGQSPSRVQGWLEGGYFPAEPVSHEDLLAHCRALDPLTGPGRDGNVAVLKMAAQDRACRRLRDVLDRLQRLNPDEEDTDDPDDLVEYASQAPHLAPVLELYRSLAVDVEAQGSYRNESEPAAPDSIAKTAMLPAADVATGNPVDPDDTIDLNHLLNNLSARLHGGRLPEDFVTPDEDLAIVRFAVGVARQATDWLKRASNEDLVRGVKCACAVIDITNVLGVPFETLGDEERWRSIGRLALTAFPIVRQMMVMSELAQTLMGHRELAPAEEAFLEAIRRAGSEIEAIPPIDRKEPSSGDRRSTL